jgi:hypothetical protein
LHPLWQGKGAFMKLPRSTTASGYKHYKCYITILPCRVWGRGTGNACKWEALTLGTQGEKTEESVAPHLLRVSACFLLSEVRAIEVRQMKFEWGQSMGCVKNNEFFLNYAAQFLCCTCDHSCSRPQIHIKDAGVFAKFLPSLCTPLQLPSTC